MVRGVRPALRGLRGDRRAASYATAAALSTPTAIRTAALAAALAANAVPATISAAIVIDGYTCMVPPVPRCLAVSPACTESNGELNEVKLSWLERLGCILRPNTSLGPRGWRGDFLLGRHALKTYRRVREN